MYFGFLCRWFGCCCPPEPEAEEPAKVPLPGEPDPPPELMDEPPKAEPMNPPPTEPAKKPPDPGRGFASNREHLDAELCRVDLLVKIYLRRLQSARLIEERVETSADHLLPSAWNALVAGGFAWEDPIDAQCQTEIKRLEETLHRAEQEIIARLMKSATNLFAICREFELVRVGSDQGKITRDTVGLDVLLLAFLVDRVPRYRILLETENTISPRSALTTEQALRIAQHREIPAELRRHVFLESQKLVADGLIILGPLASQSPESRYFWIDPRISAWLIGGDEWDPRIADAASIYHPPADWETLHLDAGTRAALKSLSDACLETRSERKSAGENPLDGARWVVLLQGPEGTPFLPVAQAFCRSKKPLVIDLAAARARERDWEDFIRRAYREAYLLQKPLIWHRAEVLAEPGQPEERREILLREAEKSSRLTFITSTVSFDAGNRFHSPRDYFLHLDLPLPPVDVREQIWESRLSTAAGSLLADSTFAKVLLDGLGSFQFTEGQIDGALAIARSSAVTAHPDSPALTVEDLYEGCRRQSARHLVSFAQRIQPRGGMQDLDRVVVPAAVSQQLRELAQGMGNLNTVHHRLGFERRLSLGRGLVALFTGPSGTGKTWAATLLAGTNNKDLYKVEMAAVVSKYVGETEKNLDRVFQDAQNANAVLFFDEADALFGKRGNVEQAQDRWANLEVNFLLQRIEEYTGTVILATNFRDNIDEAFLRRLQVVIQFPVPDAASRLKILQGMFPTAEKGEPVVLVPPPDQDQKDVADRFELTGGSLKNVTLDAVFRAVAEQQAAIKNQQPLKISGNHLVLGVAREYQKLNRPISRGEFGAKWHDLAMNQLKLRTGS